MDLSDVSYELQPPGLTTFFLLAQLQSGGDTLFTSQVAALKRLSPLYVAFLRTLKALWRRSSRVLPGGPRGGTVRREPVENVHPLIRKHPDRRRSLLREQTIHSSDCWS